MDTPDFTNKCYRTANDKLHSTIFYRGNLTEETADEREQRLANLRSNKGKWVYDEVKKEMVRIEDYHPIKSEINAPSVSLWNPEFSVMATGMRMSKGELKAYCKANGKELVS